MRTRKRRLVGDAFSSHSRASIRLRCFHSTSTKNWSRDLQFFHTPCFEKYSFTRRRKFKELLMHGSAGTSPSSWQADASSGDSFPQVTSFYWSGIPFAGFWFIFNRKSQVWPSVDQMLSRSSSTMILCAKCVEVWSGAKVRKSCNHQKSCYCSKWEFVFFSAIWFL